MLHLTKLDLAIVKFPILDISSEWGGGFTSVPYNIFRGIYLRYKV